MKNLITKSLFVAGRNVSLVGPTDDKYLASVIENGNIDHTLISLASKSLGSKSTFIDVGANIGYISTVLKTMRPDISIYAYEPNPISYASLKQTIKLNELRSIRTFQYGLGGDDEDVTLSFSNNNLSGAFVDRNLNDLGNHDHVKIKIRRFDNVAPKLVSKNSVLLKVDIEGFEPDFLLGAQNFIKDYRPAMIMEANHWCLNVFNQTSLPEFIKQVSAVFPLIFAFNDNGYLDLKDTESLYKFYYENCVNNNYMNVYAGFDRKLMIEALNSCFEKKELELQLQKKARELEIKTRELEVIDAKAQTTKIQSIKQIFKRLLRKLSIKGHRASL